MKYIGFNWLCKHKEQIRNSQDSISINCCTELSKTQFTIFFHVSIVKGCVTYSNCHSWLSLAGKRVSGLQRGFLGAAAIVVSWYFLKVPINFSLRQYFPSFTIPHRSMSIEYICWMVPYSEIFYSKFWVQSNFAFYANILLQTILHEHMKTSKFWNFFVSLVIYFFKYLVFYYSLTYYYL